jgi:hypothetical protein
MATPKRKLHPIFSPTVIQRINPIAETITPDEELAEQIVAVDSMGGDTAVLSPTGGIKIIAGGYDIQIQPARPARASSIESKFRALADRWRKETRHSSSVNRMAMHPAYQQIVGMGHDALPFILRELEKTRGHWLWALYAINGEDIAPEGSTFDEAVDAWLEWGRTHNHI